MVLRGNHESQFRASVPLIVLMACAEFGCLALCSRAAGQHAGDIFVGRDSSGKIVVGLEDEEEGSLTLGQRVFHSALGPTNVTVNPGFGALDAGDQALPPGVLALPGDSLLGFNAVAFQVPQGPRSTLFVWDAEDEEVEFVPATPGYTVEIKSMSVQRIVVDGMDNDIAGFGFAVTESRGFIHEHMAFTLRDGDTSATTQPIEGIYLFGMELTMAGLETSDPVLVALNTQEVGPTQVGTALQWLDANVERFQFGVPLEAGDANKDLQFDQLDLVQVQVAAKYLTGQSATWGEGDWNGAPGGSQRHPPPGDGRFDQLDIIAALNANVYLKGPYAAIQGQGMAGNAQTSVAYIGDTGEFWINAPAGREMTCINMVSVPEPTAIVLTLAGLACLAAGASRVRATAAH